MSPLVVGGLAGGLTALAALGGLLTMAVSRWRYDREAALREPVEEELLPLVLSVLLGDAPAASPRGARARRVSRDMTLEALDLFSGSSRERAIEWLEREGFVADEMRHLRSRRAWRRAEAAWRLGRMRSHEAAAPLISRLGDARFGVRDAAAGALGRIGGPDGARALIRAFTDGRIGLGIAGGAILRLDASAGPPLAAAIADADNRSRGALAELAGYRGDRMAVEAIAGGLVDEAPEVRRRCALALASLGPPIPAGVEHRLRALADDPAPFARAAAATALGLLVGDDAEPALRRLAGDGDFWVGHRAAEALSRLPSGDELGWAILLDDSPTVGSARARSRLLEWLERSGAVRRRMELLTMTADPSLLDALRALERAGSDAWAILRAGATA